MDNEIRPFDVAMQAPHEDNARRGKALRISALIIVVTIAAAFVIVPSVYYKADTHYFVAINSARILIDSMSVSFNLTLGVASWSHGAKACIEPGMYVEVLYRGVKVAASNPAEARRTCARPRKEAAELPVVASATMMPMGDVLDSLAAEMGQGAALFDMRWIVPAKRAKAHEVVLGCTATQVGDPAVACGSPTYTRPISG